MRRHSKEKEVSPAKKRDVLIELPDILLKNNVDVFVEQTQHNTTATFHGVSTLNAVNQLTRKRMICFFGCSDCRLAL